MRRIRLALPLALVLTLLLSACASSGGNGSRSTGSSSDGSASSGASGFPVTMRGTLGTTTIASPPKRVVTLGWGVADAALAVGVVPVAMEYQVYGADKNGVPIWTRKKIQQLGAPMPTVLPKSTDSPAYEAIAKARPDLILATSSGVTAKQYALLKAIAPTVAYTGKPYTTPWQDVVRQTATALGRTAQAKSVLAGIDRELAREAAAHPELKGKTMAAVWDVGGTFYVYRKSDARVGFMLDLGLRNAPSVDALANGNQSFYYTLSYEKLGQLDSDIVVTYADTEAGMKTFLGKSYAKSIPAVRSGAVAQVVGQQNVAAVSPPTALSLPWGLSSLVSKLSGAAKRAGTG